MKNIGVSTACFYPMKTEDSLKLLGESGFEIAEVFLNSFSELEDGYLYELRRIAEYYGMRISSVHPFTCFAEGFLLFSDYERRFEDGVEFYKRYCNAANILGGKFIVLHGDGERNKLPIELVAERYARLYDECKAMDVTLTLENVVNYQSGKIEYVENMSRLLSQRFKLTFDIKQSIRSKISPFEFLDKFGTKIVHIHVSDHTIEHDCLPPGTGNFDFGLFSAKLALLGYDGDAIIELYSKNFSTIDDLKRSKMFLQNA